MLSLLLLVAQSAAPLPPEKVGVVSHVKVLSDRVPDMSSIEAWKKAYIRDGMTDEQKALAVWKTVRTFQHQEAPPVEHLQHEEVVQDPIKLFNVYGYGFCSMASCGVAALSRHVGLKAQGRIINQHSVSEVWFDGQWRLLDSSLMCYFPKADGKPASVDEIIAGVKAWYEQNPGYKGDEKKLNAFMRGGGWRKGPEILSRCPQYDENGWFEAATHGWYSTMIEYDGSHNGVYEYGYSQGYQVNIQLRPGERITRNWSHKGLHVNMQNGGLPGCAAMKTGEQSLRYTPKDGDLAPGRMGNGLHEWNVPIAQLRRVALAVENLDDRGRATDPSKPAVVVLRVPSSYVFLSGTAEVTAAGALKLSISDNNGRDWKDVAVSDGKGYDLTPYVFRRYDYRLRIELRGALEAVRLRHDIQHSQRPLPAFDAGKNTVTFGAGPAEGTITVEGSTNASSKGKQLHFSDFGPTLEGVDGSSGGLWFNGKGQVTFPVSVPGDLKRLRFGTHYRARDARDGIDYLVSFDGGSTWKAAGRAAGPTPGHCEYVTFADVPPKAREAQVRFSGTSRNATGIFNFRIDADYVEPHGGFRPVKVTYAWTENGQAKQDVRVVRKPQETWTITCAAKPVMGSIALELAD